MKKQEFRAYPDGRILALTGECPKKFVGQIFVGYTGSPDSLEEVVVPFGQLPPKVSDVPNEWKDALRSKGFTFEAPKAPKAPKVPRERKALPVCSSGPDGPTVLANRIVLTLSLIWGIICFGCLLFVK